MSQAKEITAEPVFEQVGSTRVHVGFTLNGVFRFADFPAPKDGMVYFIPVKARGHNGKLTNPTFQANGELTEAYEGLPLIQHDGTQMYVCRDNTLTGNPWIGGERMKGVLPECYAIRRQATDNTSLQFKLQEPTIVWPDGHMRSLKITIKANAPMLPEEFVASRSQTTLKRQATSVRNLDPRSLPAASANDLIYKAFKRMALDRLPVDGDWVEATRIIIANNGQHDLLVLLKQDAEAAGLKYETEVDEHEEVEAQQV